jgi:hypothetical protein
VKDAAEIQASEASTIQKLINSGYTAESIVDAVRSGDWTKLQHTGLFSVQLQPAGSSEPQQLEAKPIERPLLPAKAGRSDEVRCPECDKMALRRTAPGGSFEVKCRGCGTLFAA